MRSNTCLILSLFSWAVVLDLATAQQQDRESGEDKVVSLTYDIPPYIMNEGTGGLETAILTSALNKGTDEFTYRQMSYDEVETAISRGDADIAMGVTLPSDGSYEKEINGVPIYYSYPSWPFHNYVFTKSSDNINNNKPIESIKELAKIGPVYTWESAVNELGDEFYNTFYNSTNYQPIGNQTEQVELFWNTSNALIVIDRSIFIAISEKIVDTSDVPLDQLFVEHNLFDPITTFGIGFKSKDMRDQFNSGLAQICCSFEYIELLVEYGIESADDAKEICVAASDENIKYLNGTNFGVGNGAGSMVLLLRTVVVVVVSFSLFLFQGN